MQQVFETTGIDRVDMLTLEVEGLRLTVDHNSDRVDRLMRSAHRAVTALELCAAMADARLDVDDDPSLAALVGALRLTAEGLLSELGEPPPQSSRVPAPQDDPPAASRPQRFPGRLHQLVAVFAGTVVAYGLFNC